MNLSPQELALIQEEEGNLQILINEFQSISVTDDRTQMLQQVLELRENLNDCNQDDIPQITEEINRIMQLINQREQSYSSQLDLQNPFFARMQLTEETRVRDLYIGTQVYRAKGGKIQIVDWKTSPIAALYFRYDVEEDYEEEIGGKLSEGVVDFKRVLKVLDGKLVQIQDQSLLLYKHPEKGWLKREDHFTYLKGGSGTAARPERIVTSSLGVGLSDNHSKFKHLPEITSLIDPTQFDLITKPTSGVIAIQGSAGSGKTTVALHRVAWLHHQDPKRFAADKMLVMVFSRALATYISKVLPSLGVKGVNIDAYETWVESLRRQVYGGLLPREYSEETPASVMRVKKHQAFLQGIDQYLEGLDSDFMGRLAEVSKLKGLGFTWEGLKKTPLIQRAINVFYWCEGKGAIEGKKFTEDLEVKHLLQQVVRDFIDPEKRPRELILELWDEYLSDFKALYSRFANLEVDPIPEGQLQEAMKWIQNQYIQRHNWWEEKKDGKPETFAPLDYEDDAILVYFFQKLQGSIKIGGKFLQYSHLLIDEAQDLSPLEMRVLFACAAKPYNVTFAGDVNQQMIQYNGFKDWSYLFDSLGLKGQEMSNLKVSYRSTFEIMDFAHKVLGDLASYKEFTTTRTGPPVQAYQFVHQGELALFLGRSLKELIYKEPTASVALITANPGQSKAYYEMLQAMELPSLRLVMDQDFSFTAGVDITDIHQVKGLEFDYVILLDVDAVNYPVNSYHRFLLHIGATRAAHQLWLLNYRVASELLPEEIFVKDF